GCVKLRSAQWKGCTDVLVRTFGGSILRNVSLTSDIRATNQRAVERACPPERGDTGPSRPHWSIGCNRRTRKCLCSRADWFRGCVYRVTQIERASAELIGFTPCHEARQIGLAPYPTVFASKKSETKFSQQKSSMLSGGIRMTRVLCGARPV